MKEWGGADLSYACYHKLLCNNIVRIKGGNCKGLINIFAESVPSIYNEGWQQGRKLTTGDDIKTRLGDGQSAKRKLVICE